MKSDENDPVINCFKELGELELYKSVVRSGFCVKCTVKGPTTLPAPKWELSRS